MKIKCTTLLRPIFKTAAYIGIGTPHEGYEVELMMAGAKPTLITTWPLQDSSEDYTRLQPLIDFGHIVVTGIKASSSPYHIICRPEDVAAAEMQAIIENKIRKESPPSLTQDEWTHNRSFWRDYYCIQSDGEGLSATDRNHRFKTIDLEPQRLLDGEIRATLPIMTGPNFSFGAIPHSVAEKIRSGELCAVHVMTHVDQVAVLAQSNCQELGHELYMRYLENSIGYPSLPNDLFTKRVGQLLGYSDADTAFFLGTGTALKSEHSLVDKARIAAFPLLRYMRAELMLYDAHHPK